MKRFEDIILKPTEMGKKEKNAKFEKNKLSKRREGKSIHPKKKEKEKILKKQ